MRFPFRGDAVHTANQNAWVFPHSGGFYHFLPDCMLCAAAASDNSAIYQLNRLKVAQNDSRRASSQDYYTSTVDALNAKDAAKADIARKFAESRHAAKQGAEPVAVKPVGEQGQAPTEIGVSDRGDESAGFKKVVAGRKAMKGGEKWDVASGKEAAMQVDKEGKLGEPETQEEHEMEMEMNAILKKGPSNAYPADLWHQANSCGCSHYIFQVILPVLRQGKAHFA